LFRPGEKPLIVLPLLPSLLSGPLYTPLLALKCCAAARIFPPQSSSLRCSTDLPAAACFLHPQAPFDKWHYPIGVIPRIYKASRFQSPSKLLLDMTFIPAVIPVRLNHLPLNGVHNLYAAILENPVALYAIEQDQEFKETPLVHHYIRLYHNYARGRVDLISASTLSSIALQRWSNRLAAMRFEILQLLVLAEYGRFFERCIPHDIFQLLL